MLLPPSPKKSVIFRGTPTAAEFARGAFASTAFSALVARADNRAYPSFTVFVCDRLHTRSMRLPPSPKKPVIFRGAPTAAEFAREMFAAISFFSALAARADHRTYPSFTAFACDRLHTKSMRPPAVSPSLGSARFSALAVCVYDIAYAALPHLSRIVTYKKVCSCRKPPKICDFSGSPNGG